MGMLRPYFSKNKTRWVTQIGIGLYVIGNLIYLVLGQVNADEGWYLYASKLVFQGALLYRDFAYTQMPLLPYIYGVLQIVHPSLFIGEITSVILSMGTLGMGIVIARKFAGARAGGIAALLFAAFTFGIYYNSIAKTYALLSFFFTATLFVLSLNLQDAWKYPLALLFALSSVLVRITAILYAVPVLVFVLIAAPLRRTRAILLLECTAVSVIAGSFLLPEWETARWNLFDSHLRHWNKASPLAIVVRILIERLPDIFQNFGPALVLFAASIYFVVQGKGTKLFLRRNLTVLIGALGLVLFAASHLANGLWEVEYLVPAATTFVPILAIVVSQVYDEQTTESRVFVQGALIASLLFFPLTESLRHIDLSGRRLPLTEIESVATFVANHSQPTDKVLALEAIGVALEANRSVLPGLTLAQFSLQLVDTATARRLHVVNAGMLADDVNQVRAKVIVLTERDMNLLNTTEPSSADALRQGLSQRYDRSLTLSKFGQFGSTVYVYLRR